VGERLDFGGSAVRYLHSIRYKWVNSWRGVPDSDFLDWFCPGREEFS